MLVFQPLMELIQFCSGMRLHDGCSRRMARATGDGHRASLRIHVSRQHSRDRRPWPNRDRVTNRQSHRGRRRRGCGLPGFRAVLLRPCDGCSGDRYHDEKPGGDASAPMLFASEMNHRLILHQGLTANSGKSSSLTCRKTSITVSFLKRHANRCGMLETGAAWCGVSPRDDPRELRGIERFKRGGANIAGRNE